MNTTFSDFCYAFRLPKFWDSLSQLCCVFIAAFFIAMLGSTASHAKLVEEVIKVPVVVKNNYGKEVAQDIVVTVFYESTAPKPYPVLVFGHGRIADADGRAAMGRIRESSNSRWLTQLGFMVAVPTRVGYGASGGEDMEDTGTCQRKNYPTGFAAAAEQMLKVL